MVRGGSGLCDPKHDQLLPGYTSCYSHLQGKVQESPGAYGTEEHRTHMTVIL